MFDKLIDRVTRRPWDRRIGGADNPYMLRWFVIPRNRLCNIYLHHFLRSDDDRALHDHPWANMSILLRGNYVEHQIDQGGIHQRYFRKAGHWYVRPSGKIAHRVELTEGPVWTLFITGPVYRSWGFHCPEQGWIHWEDFTGPGYGDPGPGCDQ
jgi:hypothetical protein